MELEQQARGFVCALGLMIAVHLLQLGGMWLVLRQAVAGSF
jgi:hypothetical protein